MSLHSIRQELRFVRRFDRHMVGPGEESCRFRAGAAEGRATQRAQPYGVRRGSATNARAGSDGGVMHTRSSGRDVRRRVEQLVGAVILALSATACSELGEVVDPDWRAIFEENSGIDLPADAEFTMIARSDGGFTADFVSVYRIHVPDPEPGGLFDPETYTRAADGGDGEHLARLTEEAGETGDDVSDVHPTHCKWDLENEQFYELILCRTAEDGEFLAFETHI